MKMMKLTYVMVFALAITLAATGCKNHRPVKVTPIPGSPGMTSDQGPGSTLPPGEGVQSQPGSMATTSLDEFEGMTKDPAALAAYTIHFAYDSAAIKKSEKDNLQAVASKLSADSTTKLLIEGNCDERGTEEYNRSLGERRALAAREALSKLGIDPSRIRTISYGKDKPVDPANNEAAWSKNRRDDFVLLHPKAGA